MWRRTTWFRLAFGGWGKIRPPSHQKDVLMWTGLGEWSDGFSGEDEDITQPIRRI